MKLASASILLVALSAGCSLYFADDSDPDPPTTRPPLIESGSTYVVSRIRIPQSSAEAAQYAIDLNGDGIGDNSLGQTIALGDSLFDAGSQQELDDAVASGAIMHLILLGDEPSDGEAAGARVFLGEDADGDSANNFDGDALLRVRADSPIDEMVYGDRDESSVHFIDGELTIENILFGAVTLPLVRGKMEATIRDDGSIDGVVAGAVQQNDIDSILEPAIIESIQTDVARDCPATDGICCVVGSRGEIWVSLMDSDDDCQVTSDEVSRNSVVRALLAPDIELDETGIDNGLSVGFGFEAVPARFSIPGAN